MTELEQRERDALKPCPLCKGEAGVHWHEAYSNDSSFAYIGCKPCGLMMEVDSLSVTTAEIEAWNTRHESARTQQAAQHEGADVDDMDAEIAIAEAIQIIPRDHAYEDKGVPVLEYLKNLGYRVVRTPEQPQEGKGKIQFDEEAHGYRYTIGEKAVADCFPHSADPTGIYHLDFGNLQALVHTTLEIHAQQTASKPAAQPDKAEVVERLRGLLCLTPDKYKDLARIYTPGLAAVIEEIADLSADTPTAQPGRVMTLSGVAGEIMAEVKKLPHNAYGAGAAFAFGVASVIFNKHISALPQNDDSGLVEAAFSSSELPKPNAFLQWKGTNACFDFSCKCGAHCHFDGYFAYYVKCPHCTTIYQMPSNLFPREVNAIPPNHCEPMLLDSDDEMHEASQAKAGAA